MRSSNHLARTENRRCSVPFCAGTARPRTGEDAGEGGVAWGPVARGRRRPDVRGGEAKQRGGRTGGREAEAEAEGRRRRRDDRGVTARGKEK